MKIKSKYYICDSIEDIQILHPNGEITFRPVMVKGMKKHTPEQLDMLLSKAIWSLAALRVLEGW